MNEAQMDIGPASRSPIQSPPAPDRTTLTICLAGAFFGLASGWLSVFVMATRTIVESPFAWWGTHSVWLRPTVELVLGIGGAFLAVVLTRPFGYRTRILVSVAALATAAIFGVLSDIHWLHPAAKALLALGVGTQAARLAARRLTSRHTAIELATGAMFILVVVSLLVTEGWNIVSERRAVAATPPAAPNAPNAVLIVLDCVRADHMGAYGYDRDTTPIIDRLAARGVLFENAIATAPWTLPSHAGMFTGRAPTELDADWLVPLDGRHETLAGHLWQRGYITAGFSANLYYASRESGLDRGFHHFEGRTLNAGAVATAHWLGRKFDNMRNVRKAIGFPGILGRRSASTITSDCLTWLDQNRGKPFLLFLNYFDAHIPYLPPSPFDKKFGPQEHRAYYLPGSIKEKQLTPDQLRSEIDAYDGAIAYMDHEVGVLIEALRSRGLLDNTLVIITSDHGEQFGEHGFYDHANSLYRQLLHVPLIFHFGDRIPAGKRVETVASLRDLPATLTDLLDSDEDAFPGASLARRFFGKSHHAATGGYALSKVTKAIRQPAHWQVSKGDMYSLTTDEMHYIRNGDGTEELYNFRADPAELTNFATDPGASSVLLALRAQIDDILAGTADASDHAAPGPPGARAPAGFAVGPQRAAPNDDNGYDHDGTSPPELLFDANRN